MMRKTLYGLILVVLGLLVHPAACFAAPVEVPVSSVYGSDLTDPAMPLWHLTDGNPGTAWATRETSPAEAWFVLKLSAPAVIDYLELSGTNSGAGMAAIQYADEDGIWQPFLGRRHTALANGIIDLSWNQAGTDRIRFIVCNNPGAPAPRLGNIGEIKIYGHEPELSICLPSNVTASSENPGYKTSFLADRNTYTAWRSANGANTASAELTLPRATALDRVKLFVRGGAGLLNLSALAGGSWTPIGASIDLSSLAAGWHAFSAAGMTATAVKLELTANGAGYVGGLGEVEIWGTNDQPGMKTVLLGETQTGLVTLGIDIAGLSSWSRAEIWDVMPADFSGTSGTYAGSVNGKNVTFAYTVLPGLGCKLARIPLSLGDLREGRNVLYRNLAGNTVEESVLVLYRDNGRLALTGLKIGGINQPDLFDGHCYTGSSASADTLEIDLPAVAIDAVRFYAPQAPGSVTLSVWADNAWVPLDPLQVTLDGLTLRIAGGTVTTTRLKIQADTAFIASLTEVELDGSPVNQGPPQVTITAPPMYSAHAPNQTVQIKGYVDNPEVTVTVTTTEGTFPAALDGHRYTCVLTVPSVTSSRARTVTVTATDTLGRTGQQVVLYYNVQSTPDLTCDQASPYYTNASQVNISGTTGPNYTAQTVKVNGVTAVLSNGSYAATVALAEGENLIVIEAIDGHDGVTRMERRVIRDSAAPTIRVSWPIDGMTVTESTLTVLGTCRDVTPATLTVNGQATDLVHGVFSRAVTLVPGANTITIAA